MASMAIVAQTNLAAGKTSIATSGTASLGNDGNTGTRWESAQSDPQQWQVDLGEATTFNTIQIVWEGAYGKTFAIVGGDNVGDDGFVTGGDTIAKVEGQSLSGFPYTQTIRLDADKKYRYVEFVGLERGTGWGYSFWEFRVIEASATQTLTTFTYAPEKAGKNDASLTLGAVNSPVKLTLSALDQDGLDYSTAGATFAVTGAGGTLSSDGLTFTPSAKGLSTITATLAGKTATVNVYAYEGSNLAQGKLSSFSGEVAGSTAAMAFDENEGTRWASGTDVSETNPAYLVADLAAYYDIDAMELYFENANPKDFTVEFSKDGTTWTTGETVTGLAGFMGGRYFYYNPANNCQVRYVKFNSTAPATAYGVSIYEFRVYGSGKTAIADNAAPTGFTATASNVTALGATLNLKTTDDVASTITYSVVDATNGVNLTFSGASGAAIAEDVVLNPGVTYNLSITASDGVNTTDPVVVEVTTPSLPSIPEPPTNMTFAGIYGSAIGNANGYGWYSWGGSSDSGTAIKVDGNDAFLIRNFTYYGSQFGAIDVSEYDTLHFDIYAASAAPLTVVPINTDTVNGGNQPEKGFQYALEAGKWNSINVPIADIIARGTTMKTLYQIKYVSTIANAAAETASDGFTNGDGTLALVVGNIYAFRSAATAVDNVNAAKTVAGVTYYNVAGMQSATPFSGLNIVVSTYTDGTRSVRKILK